MHNQPREDVWRAFGLQALVGIVAGFVAAVTTRLLYAGLYAVSFDMVSQLDSWLAFAIFAGALIVSIILSGMLGNLAGGVIGAMVIARFWRPSRRWLALWRLTWILGGLGVWWHLVEARGSDPTVRFDGSEWWVLMGMTIATGFALIAPPWRRPPSH